MDAHTTETYKGWTIEIHYDTDGESPREWDNLGKMCCWHRRMNLGDEQPNGTPTDYVIDFLEQNVEYNSKEYDRIQNASSEQLWKMFEKYVIYLPIFAYEHGGITIRSGSFSDPWDSGQLGFIYVSKEKALKEFSQKKWSKKLEDKIIKILDGEIETYDQYLTGDVHGYMIYRPEDGDCDESVDSCWGFYGEKYCMEEAKSLVDWHIENDEKQEKLFNACLSL